MVLAVGDGNHSLATAKAYWEELKPTLSEEQRRTHPARWCLAEVCNVHSPPLRLSRSTASCSASVPRSCMPRWTPGTSSRGAVRRCPTSVCAWPMPTASAVALANPPAPLTVGSVEAFLADFLPAHPGVTVDYIHGEVPPMALAADPPNQPRPFCCPILRRPTFSRALCWAACCPARPSAWAMPRKNDITMNAVSSAYNRIRWNYGKAAQTPNGAPHRRRRRRPAGNGSAPQAQQPRA